MKLTFDSARECLREFLPKEEIDSLIPVAIELRDDPRSARELADEFDVPVNIVEGLQSSLRCD